MKTKLAVAGALLALAGPVCGAHWKPVSVTPERSIYIDMDALVRNGNTVQAWDWQKFGTGQTSATWQGTFFWVKSLTSYHCMQRTTDAVLKIYLRNDGVEIKRAHLEGLQFPAAVEPDSLREKLLEMACNPAKVALKPVATATATATKLATETIPAEIKSPDSAPKPDATASTDKTTAAKSDPAKAVSKPAKAEEKTGTIAKPEYANSIVQSAKPAAQPLKRVQRQTYSRVARSMSKKKPAGGLKLAKAKLRDLKCPPPDQVAAPEPAAASAQPIAPTPQLTDAGNDGVFN